MTQPAPAPAPLVTFEIDTKPPCRLEIGRGVSRRLPGWLSSRARAGLALVTDSNVERLHAGPLRKLMSDGGHTVTTTVIPAGEAAKTRATKEMVEDALIDAGLSRDSLIIAMGGGVVTDISGFVAATYMRGIPWVAAPTTLLAMVDAAVGGKTGVDHPRGKNLIGAFHQPSAVFSDIEFLATLPEREYRSGLAEVLKAAVIRDAGLFLSMKTQAGRLGARDPDLMTGLVAAACRIKADVVAADEREGDLRMILNFGHTIGHALELLSGYQLTHGEAISIGMVAESRMATGLGLLSKDAADEIELTLGLLGLPVRLPAGAGRMPPEKILEAARHDKKARIGRIMLVLPEAIGRMARGPDGHGIALSEQLAIEVLKALV